MFNVTTAHIVIL